jgi:hypothetical protein
VTTTVFEPRPLPRPVAGQLRRRLARAHAEEPFSVLDPRHTVRRVAALAADLHLETTIYRGGLDLRGFEVDHVWLGVSCTKLGATPEAGSEGGSTPHAPWVVDATFPLFMDRFVEALHDFVAGYLPAEALADLAEGAGVDQRVVGLFPDPVRYLGAPVWSARD